MDDQPAGYARHQDIERVYRRIAAPDLYKTRICIGESDLMVLTSVPDLGEKLTQNLKKVRRQLKQYIMDHPAFAETLAPYPQDAAAPELVRWMIEATRPAGVGPMAAIAGAIAGMLGAAVGPEVTELIIENGGDIYLRSVRERMIAIYAGTSVFSNRIGLRVAPQPQGVGICTSAGTVGPSLSFGKADAVVVVAPDVALADAVATATGNRVQTARDFETAVRFARQIPGVSGLVIIKDDQLTAWGAVELTPL